MLVAILYTLETFLNTTSHWSTHFPSLSNAKCYLKAVYLPLGMEISISSKKLKYLIEFDEDDEKK